jgi:hypothetical protein
MKSQKQHFDFLLNRIAFFAVLAAMLMQPAFHMLDFVLDAHFDGISMELLQDMGEKELEEQGEIEKVELQSNPNDLQEYELFIGHQFQKNIPIIWAFTPETHIPPPEHL